MGDAGRVNEAEKRRKAIVAEISRLGPAAAGSVADRFTRCQRQGCHCQGESGELHGPYPTWTRRENGRTITKTLQPDQVEDVRASIEARARLRALVRELEEVSSQLVADSLDQSR
jgi:hypothetical protein